MGKWKRKRRRNGREKELEVFEYWMNVYIKHEHTYSRPIDFWLLLFSVDDAGGGSSKTEKYLIYK